MIEHCKTWPSTEGHKNLLLYEDSDDDFVVYAVVRMPAAPAGFTITPTHRPFMDLSTASRDWNDPGASTPLKGRTMRLFDSKASAKASPGKVDLVQPFATSLEKGGPDRSVAVIVRSEWLGWSSFAGPSRCQDVQNTIRTKARRRCRSNCLEQWVERKVNSPQFCSLLTSRRCRLS
jgi:hypothetical protein